MLWGRLSMFEYQTTAKQSRSLMSALLSTGAILVGVSFDIPSARAATAANAIETVVVTARRRAEDIQRVPVAVTALGQKDLDAQQIHANTDLKYVVPSLNGQNAYVSIGGASHIAG